MASKDSHEDYVAKVREICGEDYQVLTTYTRSKDLISIKHLPCGSVWTGLAGRFLLKKGICSNRKCIQKKMAATCLERHGVDNYFKSDHVKSLPKAMQTQEGRKKIMETRSNKKYTASQLEFHSRDTLRSAILSLASKLGRPPLIAEIVDAAGYSESSTLYDLGLSDHKDLYQYCPNNFHSKPEAEIADWLVSLGYDIVQGSRPLDGLEIDILVPSKNLGIEYNGDYWHSEKFKTKLYHEDKFKIAKEKGIRLLQFWDSEYRANPEIIKGIILSALGHPKEVTLGARRTSFRRLSVDEAKDFFSKNHLQGYCVGQPFGLEYSGEIVSAILIKNYGSYLDLCRYSLKPGTSVSGGFGKLITNIESIFGIKKWKTFADLRYVSPDDNVYLRNGFIEQNRVPPDYYYWYRSSRTHKFNLRKDRLMSILEIDKSEKEKYTERELADMANAIRVYDAGKVSYSRGR